MFTLKQIAILALVGTAFAGPIARDGYDGPYGRWPGNQGWHRGDTVVVTEPADTTGSDSTPVTVQPVPTAAPAAPSAPAASSSSAPSSGGSDTGYMATVNQWRAAGGLPLLTESSQLVANALKTATDDNGVMSHELNSGSMAQVLAPGNANNFPSVYEGGWLCEKPDLPYLAGKCASAAQGWDHSNGETGHADILTSTTYTKIGCALATGIWACDLA